MAVAGLATRLMTKAAEGLAGAAVGKLFQKGFDVIQGGSDTEKIREDINKVLQEVQKVKEIVEEMSKKLDVGIQRLRSDTLRTSLTSIGTVYDGVHACINSAFNAKKEISSSEALNEKLAQLQLSLDDKLKDCVKTLPGLLDQINSFLVDSTFVGGAAQQALNGSRDFLSYYLKMKVLFMEYWVRVVQAISLLEMAKQSSKVQFPEGGETIRVHKGKVQAQEDFFKKTVGEQTCSLGELILQDPATGRKEVAFSTSWGAGFKLDSWTDPSINQRSVPSGNGEKQRWLIEPASPEKLEPNRDYVMALYDGGTGWHLGQFPGVGYSIVTPSYNPSHWFFKPTSVGSDMYYMICDNGKNAYVEWTHNWLELRDNPDEKIDRGYIALKPW